MDRAAAGVPEEDEDATLLPSAVPCSGPPSVILHKDDCAKHGLQDDASPVEPGLNVRLLKERLEMEVGLRREGMRATVFVWLCICFAMAFFLSTQPQFRAESRAYMTQRLGLLRLKHISSPESVFETIMAVSSAAREMVPTSSMYLTDPLAKVMIGSTREGRVKLPADRHPALLLEWTLTARVRHQVPDDPNSRRRLIVRSFPSGDESGMSCWAWYTRSFNMFEFEYGRNNLDDNYPVLIFDFSGTDLALDPKGLNFVSLSVNATSVIIRLENHAAIAQPLASGTVPSGCADSTMEVGDKGILLGNLVYHPKHLSVTQLDEIQHYGQTLEDMVSGAKLEDPVALMPDVASDAHLKTQQLVQDFGASNLAVSKLTGLLAYMGAENSTFQQVKDRGLKSVAEVGAPLPVSSDTGMQYWNVLDDEERQYWAVVGRDGVNAKDPVQWQAMQMQVSAAFGSLAASRQPSVTVSWWAKASANPHLLSDIAVLNPETGEEHFMMLRNVETDIDGTMIHGWIVSFKGSPWCESDEDVPCMESPGFWCQGPDVGGYDGIWRHYAVRFNADDGSGNSEFEMFLDGRSLCMMTFPSRPELIPHYLPNSAYIGAFLQPAPVEDNNPLWVRDVRIYWGALNSMEVWDIAMHPEEMECLDLSSNSDNSSWTSEFGQSCADLSDMSTDTRDTYAPAACRLPEAQRNCPISCMHELSPSCYDGMPPLPKQNSLFSRCCSRSSRMFIAEVYLRDPELGQKLRPSKVSQEGLQRLTTVGSFRDRSDGSWQPLFNDIRKLDFGSIIPSVSVLQAMQAVSSPEDTFLWATSRDMNTANWCPGIELDAIFVSSLASVRTDAAIITDFCTTENQASAQWQFWADGREMDKLMINSGWANSGFSGDMFRHGESATLYFWAKTGDVQGGSAPRISGIDTNRNFCFNIRGTKLWMMKRNLVSQFVSSQIPSELVANNISMETLHEHIGEDLSMWNEGRLFVEAPKAALSSLKPNTWTFFGIAVDAEKRVVRYAMNGFVTEIPLPEGDWGCDQMDMIVNSGLDVDVSPLRIVRFPLGSGSLQNLYLSSRNGFAKVFTGEDMSRTARMTMVQRPYKSFTKKMVSLSPPILIQKRADGQHPNATKCKGNVTNMFNERQKELIKKKCQSPYVCPVDPEPIRCLSEDSPHPKRFFGQDIVMLGPDRLVFPEFAWSLERDVIVRDGIELRPAVDYIDDETLDLEFIIVLYSPHTRVATLFLASFDLSGGKVHRTLSFQQVNLMDEAEFQAVVAWAMAGVVMAVLSVVLAIPAALREVSEFFQKDLGWLQRSSFCNEGQKRPLQPLRNIRIYSTNTTQPDLFDVILNVGMVCLLVSFILNQKNNQKKASLTFSEMTSIDWGSDMPLQQKISNFMIPMEQAGQMVMTEEAFLNAAFYMLAVCCVRAVIYMKLHPTISSVAETFTTVGFDLLNFMFSFGIIFSFMAYIAHIRFGYMYDEFSTWTGSLVTQFSLLIGDKSIDYTEDSLLTLYIVSYVFVCTLSLLNFLLAIVVNGYTAVTERVLENKVARNLLTDMSAVPVDVFIWTRHRWTSKLTLLRLMQNEYPDVFAEEDELVVSMSREKLRSLIASHEQLHHDSLIVPRNSGSHAEACADGIFDHYCQMKVLLLFPEEPQLATDRDLRQHQVQLVRQNTPPQQAAIAPVLRFLSGKSRRAPRRIDSKQIRNDAVPHRNAWAPDEG